MGITPHHRMSGVRAFVLLLVSLAVGCNGCNQPSELNRAAGLGWRGFVDTDLQFSEFYGSAHTLTARFMLQYPRAYVAPILAVNGSGTFLIAKDILTPRLIARTAGTQAVFSNPSLVAGHWYHLAVVRSGNQLTFYLDGNKICPDGVTGCTVAAGTTPSGNLRLGRLTNGSNLVGHEAQFYGLVDDVAVLTKALTQAEISALRQAPRITGNESQLLAGYTFDELTPAKQPLPPALSRPVTMGTLTMGTTLPGAPAYLALVSLQRLDSIDVKFLPPPIQQAALELPFAQGEVWQVGQGWEGNISHNGRAAFAWDFNIAGQPASATNGKAIYAAAGGLVVETRNDRNSCSGYPANYVMIQQAAGEIGAYLHFVKGTVQPAQNANLANGAYLADAGDTGNTGCGSYHLHFGHHNLPESQAGSLVTFPAAFSNYEVSTDGGQTWQTVQRGVPQQGEWLRRQ